MDSHVAVVGLGFGDESKGATVDWLCRRDGQTTPVAVVRLGGHQAGHNVVEPGGRHHTFAQFGSGTLAGVPTFLSRYMTVEPMALVAEAERLMEIGISDPYEHLAIDGDCIVVTPYHRWSNLLNAANLRHGTCGKGHGEAIRWSIEHPQEVLRVRDLRHRPLIAWVISEQRRRFEREHPVVDGIPDYTNDPAELLKICDVFQMFGQVVRITLGGEYLAHLMKMGPVIFEHSQGVLLDEWYGFHPNTTWSTTTFENIDKLAAEAGAPKPFRLGCLRTYTTRHGAGPFPTEDKALDVLPEPHNAGGMQGEFRRGYFDAVLHRYAINACGGVNGISLSHVDLAHEIDGMCRRYSHKGHEPYVDRSRNLNVSEGMGNRLRLAVPIVEQFYPAPIIVEEALGYPVRVVAEGPTHEDRQEVERAQSALRD